MDQSLSPNNTNINLSAGSVSYSIVDANNCVKTNAFELTEPEALTATIAATTVWFVLEIIMARLALSLMVEHQTITFLFSKQE